MDEAVEKKVELTFLRWAADDGYGVQPWEVSRVDYFFGKLRNGTAFQLRKCAVQPEAMRASKLSKPRSYSLSTKGHMHPLPCFAKPVDSFEPICWLRTVGVMAWCWTRNIVE